MTDQTILAAFSRLSNVRRQDPRPSRLRFLAVCSCLLMLFAAAAGQGLSGRYTAVLADITYSLSLSPAGGDGLTGTFSSSTGMRLRLDGSIIDDGAGGTCYQGDVIAGYFELVRDGNRLAFLLTPAGADGMPDMENAKELVFSPTGSSKPPAGQPQPEPAPRTPAESGPKQVEAPGEVGNPGWAFTFTPPSGWRCQADAQGAVLGHDQIAGGILILPHRLRSLEKLGAQMAEGLQENEGQLKPTGALKTQDSNRLAGDFSGFYQGQTVKGYGIGTVSPSGGAYIIALTAPDKFTTALSSAADLVAASMRYREVKGGGSELMSHFAGTWVSTTTNTETRMTFYPDGTFAEGYEASYSGGSSDAQGNPDMSWGTAGEKRTAGSWSAQGTVEQGVITITYENGNSRDVNYRVHVENGETYPNEYWFANDLYGRQSR